MTAAQKIEARIARQNVKTLKEMAEKLFNDTRDGAEIVFSKVLDALMARLPEAEFVAFCERLEG